MSDPSQGGTSVYQSYSGNTYLFGGFNSNGKEAGYLFQKSVPNGVLMGTTLWGR